MTYVKSQILLGSFTNNCCVLLVCKGMRDVTSVKSSGIMKMLPCDTGLFIKVAVMSGDSA